MGPLESSFPARDRKPKRAPGHGRTVGHHARRRSIYSPARLVLHRDGTERRARLSRAKASLSGVLIRGRAARSPIDALAADAAKRKVSGRGGDHPANLPDGAKGDTRDKIAELAHVSSNTVSMVLSIAVAEPATAPVRLRSPHCWV